MPLLSPNLFREAFRSPSPLSQPPHAIIACVLAWGAKFSEHPLILNDREETSAIEAVHERRDSTERNKSRLVRTLVARAQEVLEANRCHRIASLPNVQAAYVAL